MAVIQSIKNQYLGINAHLHSLWQAEGKWNRFHGFHAAEIMAALKARLIPLGYTVQIEESLQIRRFGEPIRSPKSDILIRDRDPQRPAFTATAVVEHIQAVALEEILNLEVEFDHPSAVVVFDLSGEAVAWIEILSPTNKGTTKDAETYRTKRQFLLEKKLVFVELDYLHETQPTFNRLPDYTHGDPRGYPYRIVVVDPRPEFTQARAWVYEFSADTAIPSVTIPLNADDKVVFDFGAAYQTTFERALYGYDMNYAEFPLNFDRYSPADQTRIARRILAVLKAHQAGGDLENAPFPIEDISLDEALKEITLLTASP